MKITDEVYQNIVNAIVLGTVEDYRKVKVVIKGRYGDKGKTLDTIDEVKKFFNSRWLSELINIAPIALLEKLEEE